MAHKIIENTSMQRLSLHEMDDITWYFGVCNDSNLLKRVGGIVEKVQTDVYNSIMVMMNKSVLNFSAHAKFV